jgi:hypothetical protein
MQAADDPGRLQDRRRVDDQVVAAPDVERRLLEEERKAHREQHLAQRLEAERPQEHALHRKADYREGERRHRQGEKPGARGPDDGQRDIAAEQEVSAMREVDDAHHAKDQR